MSKVVVNKIQLGQDQVTDANNLLITAGGDGSLTVAQGVEGNTGSAIIEITTAGQAKINNIVPISESTAINKSILYSIVLGG